MRLSTTERKILQALSTETSILVREVSRALVGDRQVRREDSAFIAMLEDSALITDQLKLLRAKSLVESQPLSGGSTLSWRRTEKGTKALEKAGE